MSEGKVKLFSVMQRGREGIHYCEEHTGIITENFRRSGISHSVSITPDNKTLQCFDCAEGVIHICPYCKQKSKVKVPK